MDDLIGREDVLALLPDTDTVGPKPSALREKVARLPGVVRCRDCVHHAVYAESGKHICWRPLGVRTCMFVDPEGFCHNGTTRTETKERS